MSLKINVVRSWAELQVGTSVAVTCQTCNVLHLGKLAPRPDSAPFKKLKRWYALYPNPPVHEPATFGISPSDVKLGLVYKTKEDFSK